MGAVSKSSGAMLMLAMFAAPAMGGLTAQAQEQAQEASDSEVMTTVYGQLPSPEEMTKGPKVEGIISARRDGRMQVTTADGNNTANSTEERRVGKEYVSKFRSRWAPENKKKK